MQEIWKQIPGFEGLYEASNHGHIRSVDRYVRGVSKTGREHVRHRVGLPINQVKHNCGYLEVTLSNGPLSRRMLVHQVIATTFLHKPDDAQCVNHKNGNKKDNHVENIEWCSFAHNVQHANKTGMCNHAKGTKKPFSKLVDSDIREIRKRILSGENNTSIASYFGVSQPTISTIKHGKAWSHVA